MILFLGSLAALAHSLGQGRATWWSAARARCNTLHTQQVSPIVRAMLSQLSNLIFHDHQQPCPCLAQFARGHPSWYVVCISSAITMQYLVALLRRRRMNFGKLWNVFSCGCVASTARTHSRP